MAKRNIFRKAELNKHTQDTSERKVSWLELYFDLFFVVVIYYLVHELSYDVSIKNLFEYTVMFLSTLWLWISYTYYKETFQNHGLEIRIFTFFYMIPIASLAVFSNEMIQSHLNYFILSYFIARLMLTVAWAHWSYINHEFRWAWKKLFKGIILSLIFLILAYFDVWWWALYLFIVALIIDYVNPIFSIHKQSELNINLSRLPERFWLFMIIVIWEIVRWVINSLSEASEINFSYIFVAVLLFSLSYWLWSIYFDYLPNKLVTKNLKKTFAWIYLHVLLLYFLTLIWWVILKFNLWNMVIPNPPLSMFLTIWVSLFMIFMWIVWKIVDGKDIHLVEKKRSSAKIYTWLAILLTWIILHVHSVIIVLSAIVFLLLLQILYTIHLWKNNLEFE